MEIKTTQDKLDAIDFVISEIRKSIKRLEDDLTNSKLIEECENCGVAEILCQAYVTLKAVTSLKCFYELKINNNRSRQ